MTAPRGMDEEAWEGTKDLPDELFLDDLVSFSNALLDRFERKMPTRRAVERVDARTVRFYTSEGVLDPPTKSGRKAVYRPRHVLALLAIKSCQSKGLSLAQTKEVLAGSSDAALRRVACASSSPGDTAEKSTPTRLDPRPVVAFDLGGGFTLLAPTNAEPSLIAALDLSIESLRSLISKGTK